MSVDATRIEVLGPLVEAAASVHGVEVRLLGLDAAIEPADLKARPSRIWAAIGNAADERAVARDRGERPRVRLLEYVRVEETNGGRVARDSRRALVDPIGQMPGDFSPMKFDDAGWHADAASNAGQPPAHAWTHIALFLTWLIRHDLVNLKRFRRDDLRAVKAGAIVGRSMMEWIDPKLVSDLMTDAGVSFSEACYEAYLEAYQAAFEAEPDYSIAATHSAYSHIAPAIDILWTGWLARAQR